MTAYSALARGGRHTVMGAALDFIPDDPGTLWDPSVITRAFDATPQKTYGAVVALSGVAARVLSQTSQIAGSSATARTLEHLTEAVKNAGQRKASEIASPADWSYFRTWFLQAFWDFNGATAGAQYLAKRQSLWREVKDQWEVVQRKLAEAAGAVGEGAKKAILGMIPWWGWAIIVVGGVFVIGGVVAPFVIPLISAKIGQKRISVTRHG